MDFVVMYGLAQDLWTLLCCVSTFMKLSRQEFLQNARIEAVNLSL